MRGVSFRAAVSRDLRQHAATRLAMAAILGLSVARALHQSITIDEAGSYLNSYGTSLSFIRHADALGPHGNHVLHSLLVYLSTKAWGLSHFSMRLPALLGCLVYLVVCERLCQLLHPDRLTRVLTFLALTTSPFLLDYLSVGRGHGLALGFFMAALLVCCLQMRPGAATDDRASRRRYVVISVCCALSVASVVTFAFVNVSLLLVFYAMVVARTSRGGDVRTCLGRLAPAALYLSLPGAAVYALLFPRLFFRTGLMYWGSRSWSEVWHSLAAPLFDDWKPNLVAGHAREWAALIGGYLPALFLLVVVVRLVVAGASAIRTRARCVSFEDRAEVFVSAVFLLTMLLHQASFALAGAPLLPAERTGIFLVPLGIIVLSLSIAGLGRTGSWSMVARAGQIGMVLLVAYFVVCLRTSHYRMWRYDAGGRDVFGVLASWARSHEVERVWVDLFLRTSLAFYAVLHGQEGQPTLVENPVGWEKTFGVFVLRDKHAPLIEQQGLSIIYEHPVSGAVMAVRRQAVAGGPRTAGAVERAAMPATVRPEWNLLMNPSFESLDGQGHPVGWGRHATPEVVVDDSRARSGHVAVRGSTAYFYQAVAVRGGRTYVLGHFSRAERPGQASRLQVNFNDAGGRLIDVRIEVVAANVDWTWNDMTMTAPRSATTAMVYLQPHEDGDVLFDDVWLGEARRSE